MPTDTNMTKVGEERVIVDYNYSERRFCIKRYIHITEKMLVYIKHSGEI